jgi:hypothetical protein
MDKAKIRAAVAANLEWFRRSGVMLPPDGSWGVAERVAVTTGNTAIEQMLASFPAWTMHEDYCIIEQRRADCNFQAALLFLLAAKTTGNATDRETGEKLVDYLFSRSGMLFRGPVAGLLPTIVDQVPPGAWQWSHIKQYPIIYFDDNAWCIFIELALARLTPELDRKHRLTEWALRLAPAFAAAMKRSFGAAKAENADFWADPEGLWLGNFRMPHWGSLSCMALAAAHAVEPRPEYAAEIRRYTEYVDEKIESFNVSEIAYALIGACFAARHLGDDFYFAHTARLGAALLRRRQPDTGNFPAEHHESPIGPDKVDTIYTVNWALLALQCADRLTGDAAYGEARRQLTTLLLKIQDATPRPEFKGCWRGMFDLASGSWGGGDCYEGGAGSIYTGWTNAPIAIGLLLELDGKSLLDL